MYYKNIINFNKTIYEIDVYRVPNIDYFGIALNPVYYPRYKKWSIVHIPSESELLSVFKNKTEAELYLNSLSTYVNLNSLFLCSPFKDQVLEIIKEEIQCNKNFMYVKDNKYEKNNNF